MGFCPPGWSSGRGWFPRGWEDGSALTPQNCPKQLLLPNTRMNRKPPCVVGIPSRTYVKKKKKKKLENKKKKSWRWGVSVLASTGEYSGVLGSFGEYLIKLTWGGCGGVGGGYGAPRPGCVFHAEKIPRPGDVFPPKSPIPSARPKIPARPPCCSLPPSPPGLSSARTNKSPGKYPGART